MKEYVCNLTKYEFKISNTSQEIVNEIAESRSFFR